MPTLITETTDDRFYVGGSTYAVKDRLRAAGCRYDGIRKQWWVPLEQAPALRAVLLDIEATSATPKSAAPTRQPARGRCYECDATGPKGQSCRQCYEGTYV